MLEYPEFPAVMTTSLRAPLEERLVLCGTAGRIVVPRPHMAEEAFLLTAAEIVWKHTEIQKQLTDFSMKSGK